MRYYYFNKPHADPDYLGYDGIIMFPGILRGNSLKLNGIISKRTSGNGVISLPSIGSTGYTIYIDLIKKYTYRIYIIL